MQPSQTNTASEQASQALTSQSPYALSHPPLMLPQRQLYILSLPLHSHNISSYQSALWGRGRYEKREQVHCKQHCPPQPTKPRLRYIASLPSVYVTPGLHNAGQFVNSALTIAISLMPVTIKSCMMLS